MNYSLIFLSLFPLVTCWPFTENSFEQQKECWQEHEVYVECGGCEGTCQQPIVNPCLERCKPPRCECPSEKGFVRSIHGHCISVSECPGPTIYSADPERVQTNPKDAFVKPDSLQAVTGVPIGAAPVGLLGAPAKRYFPASKTKLRSQQSLQKKPSPSGGDFRKRKARVVRIFRQ